MELIIIALLLLFLFSLSRRISTPRKENDKFDHFLKRVVLFLFRNNLWILINIPLFLLAVGFALYADPRITAVGLPLTLFLQLNLVLFVSAGGHPFEAMVSCFKLVIWSIALYSFVYWHHGIVTPADAIIRQTTSLDYIYFSIVTWSTLGYGDFKPGEMVREVAAIQSVLGLVFMSMFGALFFQAIVALNTVKTKLDIE